MEEEAGCLGLLLAVALSWALLVLVIGAFGR
jgi:hypothetical protein